MRFLLAFLIIGVSFSAQAQIVDASFFPAMKTINPGVVHLRQHGFIGAELSKRSFAKQHDVTKYNLVDGIQTDVELQKATVYRAGKGPGFTIEGMFDQESGTQVDTSQVASDKRKTTSEASSTFLSGTLDFKYFGISYARSSYDFLYKFRVGAVPDLSANDVKEELTYTMLKVGSAIKLGPVRLGAYYLTRTGDGSFTYTYYDPNTGNKGDTEAFDTSSAAHGYGVGIGATGPKLRAEASFEKMSPITVDIPSDYPEPVNDTPASSRLSVVGEVKFTKLALGFRARQIKGNFYDLQDIISANLLYKNLTAEDSRLETTFNFGLGISKGLSVSGFYTQSTIKTEELDPIDPDSGDRFPAETKATAMGVNVSYVY